MKKEHKEHLIQCKLITSFKELYLQYLVSVKSTFNVEKEEIPSPSMGPIFFLLQTLYAGLASGVIVTTEDVSHLTIGCHLKCPFVDLDAAITMATNIYYEHLDTFPSLDYKLVELKEVLNG